MAQSLTTAIANIQAKWLTISGTDAAGNTKMVQSAPTNPPENNAQFPFAVTYEREADTELRSAGWADDLAIVYSELHCGRELLPQAISLAMSFRDGFIKALRDDPTLSGAIATIVKIHRTFGALEWGGVPTVGYRWEITLKVTLT